MTRDIQPRYTEIKPGDEIMRVRLPVPLDGLSAVTPLLERLYGHGNVLTRPAGHYIEFIAPEDGFQRGPVNRRTAWPRKTDHADALTFAAARDHTAVAEIRGEGDITAIIAMARLWFEFQGGINYVRLTLGTEAQEPEFIFAMQRANGATPLQVADARLDRVAQLLADETLDVDALRTGIRDAIEYSPEPPAPTLGE